MKRNRRHYLLLIIATIIIGLFSRSNFIPDSIYLYLGDFLYTIMYYFIIGFIFPKMNPVKVACASIFLCYMIEVSQLCQATWLNNIRSYKIGGLILGFGFLWSDIISYTLGGITGLVFESILDRRTNIINE